MGSNGYIWESDLVDLFNEQTVEKFLESEYCNWEWLASSRELKQFTKQVAPPTGQDESESAQTRARIRPKQIWRRNK